LCKACGHLSAQPSHFLKNPFCDASKRVLRRGVKGQDATDAGLSGDWKN
jgi:hypothetical protein